MVRCGAARCGKVELGVAWQEWHGSARRGRAGRGLAGTVFKIMSYMKQRVAWMGETRSGRSGTVRPGSVGFGRAELGIDRHGRAGLVVKCSAEQSPEKFGAAWQVRCS